MFHVDLYCVGEDHPEYKKVLMIMEEMRNAICGSKPVFESSWNGSCEVDLGNHVSLCGCRGT